MVYNWLAKIPCITWFETLGKINFEYHFQSKQIETKFSNMTISITIKNSLTFIAFLNIILTQFANKLFLNLLLLWTTLPNPITHPSLRQYLTPSHNNLFPSPKNVFTNPSPPVIVFEAFFSHCEIFSESRKTDPLVVHPAMISTIQKFSNCQKRDSWGKLWSKHWQHSSAAHYIHKSQAKFSNN